MSNTSPGTRLGPYELVGPLGAGGMGEVYRGRDTRLDRAVAIKRLPPSLASDPDARSRFEREARAVGALNHPHICTLYDVGHDDQSAFLVMELVEGETLASRLERGRLPLEHALAIAEQIAGALERAHRQGIVHRDLKPANVMIARGGAAATPHVKLLDFGLARLVDRQAVSFTSSVDVTRAPQAPMTGAGTILGTLYYMSPEQVEGKETDHRTDIFALGALLYEMLTGHRAFSGESPASTMAAILERQPAPLSAGQVVAPAWLDLVIRRALAKDPDERWQSASDIATCLREMPGVMSTAAASPPRSSNRLLALAGVALAAVAAGAAATWLLTPRSSGPSSPPLARLILPTAPATGLAKTLALGFLALSPAGDMVAFVGTAGGQRSIFVRRLDQSAATVVPNTMAAGGPFFSPDGRWLAYHTAGPSGGLIKVLLATGTATTICPLKDQIRGAVWAPDGTIIFGSNQGPLYRVSAGGGTPEPLAPLRSGELAHRWPALLPDGDHVLFNAGARVTPRWDSLPIEVLNLRTGARQSIDLQGMAPRFVQPGRLLFARDAQIMAVPFDPRSLKATGSAVSVVGDVANVWSVGASHYALSDTGTLVFASESLVTDGLSMTRVPIAAAMRSLPVPPRYYVDPIVSPNGRFVAVEDLGDADDIWVIDLQTGAPQRLTFNAGEDETPVWSPDGLWVAYASDRSEGRQILRRRADGGGAEERVWSGAAHLHVEDWTPDGRYLITSGVGEEGLGLLDLHASPPTVRVFMPAQRGVTMARLSADGRWIAYAAGESGSDEIYVQDFPQLSARWQVTQGGGVNAMWSADGRALFYRRGETLFRVPVQTAASALSFSAAVPIFKVLPGVKGNHRPWAVMPNGDALVLENKSGDQGAQLNLFLNWAATLFERPR